MLNPPHNKHIYENKNYINIDMNSNDDNNNDINWTSEDANCNVAFC